MAVTPAGLDREAIYAALYARLRGVSSLTAGVSRRLPPSNQVGPAEQPCAFLPSGRETPQSARGLPPVWNLQTVIFVYARTNDASQAPSQILTPLVKDIEAALRWRAGDSAATGFTYGGWTNLGGLVRELEIIDVEYAEGTADGQGIAFIRLEASAESPPA